MRWLIIIFLLCAYFPTEMTAKEVCKLPKREYYKTRKHHCNLGDLVPDSYQEDVKNLCEKTHYDHLISQREAYCVLGLRGQKLKNFIRDERNLLPTHEKINLSKGSKPAFEFIKTLNVSDEHKNKLLERLIENYEAYGKKPKKEVYQEYFKTRPQKLTTPLNKNPITIIPKNIKKRTVAGVTTKGAARTVGVQATRNITKAIAVRTAKAATANVSTLPAQSLPISGFVVVGAITAMDIAIACANMKDIQRLEEALGLDLEYAGPKNYSHKNSIGMRTKKVCGLKVPPVKEIISKAKLAPVEVWEHASELLPNSEEIQDFIPEEVDWDDLLEKGKTKSIQFVGASSTKAKDLADEASKKAAEVSKKLKLWLD